MSEDGKVLIIGEVKHDIVKKAFDQLDTRINTLKNAILLEALPEKFKNLKEIIGVIGGDNFNDNLKEVAKKKELIIITKQPEYIMENDEKYMSILKNYL